MQPYALKDGEGWVYRWEGVDFVVKAGELVPGGSGAAVLEYTVTEDESGHTHRTEDEIFYVLEGSMTFRCGDDTFDVDGGGFVFLPHGIRHGYSLRGAAPARVLVVTSPVREEAARGWGGFIADIEADQSILVSKPGHVEGGRQA